MPPPDIRFIEVESSAGSPGPLSYRLPEAIGAARVVSAFARLVTSATVADRVFVLDVEDKQGSVKGAAESGVVQAASLTRNYTWGWTGTAYGPTGDSTNIHIPLSNLWIFGGDQLVWDAMNLQGADVLSRVRVWLEVFPLVTQTGPPKR